MLKFISVGIFVLLSFSAQAAGTILVVGDSISAGYGLAQGQSWPSLLEKRLREQRLDYSVVNASISGDTTAGGRSRIGAAIEQARPAVVIIALGGNDGLRGLPVAALRDNLDAMIAGARARKARVVLAGMKLPPNYGPDYTQAFERSYAELAKRHKAALVPFLLEGVAENREFFQPDGIHPVAEAQPIILENVWKVLKPQLK
ncbi:MAG: Esterase TesA [Rhodocyclaceae bacterium]|nr:Esterase TesA [Rhodocyclaceae bacterium]CAG0944489.1 acyl-CoA thioesterase I [Gammaproteobacteria bacterium]